MQALEKLLRQPDNDLTSPLLDDDLDEFFSVSCMRAYNGS